MSTTLYRLGHWAVRRRRLVVVLWLVGLLLAGGTAAALQRGVVDVFEIPGTQSQQALDSLTARFPEFAGASGQVVVQARTVCRSATRTSERASTRSRSSTPLLRMSTQRSARSTSTSRARCRATAARDHLRPARRPVRRVTDAIRAPIVAITTASTQHGLRAEVGGSLFMPTPPAVTISEGIGVLVALIVLVATFGSALAAGIRCSPRRRGGCLRGGDLRRHPVHRRDLDRALCP